MKKFLIGLTLTALMNCHFANAEVNNINVSTIKKNAQTIVNNMSEEKINDTKALTTAILDLYDYQGYFQTLNKKLSQEVATGSKKVYLNCLQNNVSSELYQKYLTGQIIQYANTNSHQKIKSDIALLNNQKLKNFYQSMGVVWEDSLQSVHQNQQSLTDTKAYTQLKILSKDKEFLSLLDKLDKEDQLVFLMNLSMTTGNMKDSIVDKFTKTVGSMCLSNPNMNLMSQLK